MVGLPGYLRQRRQGYEAVVEVPPSKRRAVGRKRLTLGLDTRDPHIAKARLRPALIELHRRMDDRLRASPQTDPVTAEALAWREQMEAARKGDTRGLPVVRTTLASGEVVEEADNGLLVDLIAERAAEVAKREGDTRAAAFAGIAQGTATPITLHIEEWLSEPGKRGPRRSRTVSDYRSIVRAFSEWAGKHGHGGTVEGITRRAAGLYVQHLQRQNISATRIRTIITALIGFWAWMETRGVVTEGAANPWTRQAPRKPPGSNSQEKERAFTDDEMVKLLSGTADVFLSDLMRVGALTGMRIEEIARLTVGMCGGETIRAPGVKGEKTITPRDLPLHPDLAPIIACRVKDKASDAFVFDELGKANKHGERSPAASKRFNRYRATVGVEEREEGRRRSRVNFHSFRRWFVTRAVEAGQPQNIIRDVIGHKQDPRDVLNRSYTDLNQLTALKRACVAAVRLPQLPAADLQGGAAVLLDTADRSL